MSKRHLEFFGPDLSRGPNASSRMEVAAVEIATAIAQLRAPLSRSDSAIQDHADFIRGLADRIAPDWAAQVSSDVGEEDSNTIQTTIRVASGSYTLLDLWLADASGGGLTAVAPTSVTFDVGTVLDTPAANKRWLVVTPTTGIISVRVTYGGSRSWCWAISRHARVYYSSNLSFS